MNRWMALGAFSLALAASAPASGAVLTLTFTGVANDLGTTSPWGYDAFGTNIVGDSYVAVEMIIYDDPHANTGLVLYAPLTNTATISPNLDSAVATLTLDPADVANSGFDVVLPLDGGALYAGENVETLTTGVPEPGAWAVMLRGFGLVGARLRCRRRSPAHAA